MDKLSNADIDSIVAKMIAEKKEKQEKLAVFIKSSLFNKIVFTIIDKNIFLKNICCRSIFQKLHKYFQRFLYNF